MTVVAGVVGAGARERPMGQPAAGARQLAFRPFYEDEVRGIYAYVLAITGDRWVAEDLTQEAFSRAFRDWERVSSYDRPGAWVRKVAHNLAASRFRKLASEARALARVAGRRERETVDLPEEDAAFWAEVRSLPSRQAQAIALHYVQDLSVAQIAKVMGCAEGTAKAHLHRGRTALAQRLGLTIEHEGDQP